MWCEGRGGSLRSQLWRHWDVIGTALMPYFAGGHAGIRTCHLLYIQVIRNMKYIHSKLLHCPGQMAQWLGNLSHNWKLWDQTLAEDIIVLHYLDQKRKIYVHEITSSFSEGGWMVSWPSSDLGSEGSIPWCTQHTHQIKLKKNCQCLCLKGLCVSWHLGRSIFERVLQYYMCVPICRQIQQH